MIDCNPVFIVARDLDDAWHTLLWECYHKGRKYNVTSGSHGGSYRKSFDFVSGFIKNPHVRPLAPTLPEGKNIPVPTTDEKIEKYFAEYVMNSDMTDDELKTNEYKYASWIVGNGRGKDPVTEEEIVLCKYDQTEWVINHFKEHGFGTTHCYITVGNPDSNLAYDRPFMYCPICDKGKKQIHTTYYKKGQKVCPNCDTKLEINETKRGTSPCLRGLDFGILQDSDNKYYLTTNVIYRSWDLYSGFPENMGGFTLLNEYISDALGIEPGPMSFCCKDLHVYDHHFAILADRLNKENI